MGMWHNNRRKSLILLEKKLMHPSNLLISHNNEIGTFCIDCTDTPTIEHPQQYISISIYSSLS
jgi:hypothetical protein